MSFSNGLYSRMLEASSNGNWYDHIVQGVNASDLEAGKREWYLEQNYAGSTSVAGYFPASLGNNSVFYTLGTYNPPWVDAPEKIAMATTGNDTAAGTGAQSVRIVGMGGNWNYNTEVLATNAGTQTSTMSYVTLNDARVITHGSLNFNDNDIDFEFNTTTARKLGDIANEEIRRNYGVFGVAAGYEVFIIYEGIGANNQAPASGIYIGSWNGTVFDVITKKAMWDRSGQGMVQVFAHVPENHIAVWGIFGDGFTSNTASNAKLLIRKK